MYFIQLPNVVMIMNLYIEINIILLEITFVLFLKFISLRSLYLFFMSYIYINRL